MLQVVATYLRRETHTVIQYTSSSIKSDYIRDEKTTTVETRHPFLLHAYLLALFKSVFEVIQNRSKVFHRL